MVVDLQVERLSGFYVQYVAIMMLCLSGLGLLAFIMPLDAIVGRVNTLLTLILTAVAFKFVLASSLPKVQYTTRMDVYVGMVMGSLIITTVLAVIPHHIDVLSGDVYTQGDAGRINLYTAYVSGSLVVGSFVFWLFLSPMLGSGGHVKEHRTLTLKPNASWYAFQFNVPHFLAASNK